MKKMMSLLLAAAFTGVVSGATNPEKAGICFRFDDNQPPERWQKMAEIFEKHGYRFSMAINSEKAAADPAYAKLLSDMAARGYEVMDHTPEHTIIKLTLPRAEEANCQRACKVAGFQACKLAGFQAPGDKPKSFPSR